MWYNNIVKRIYIYAGLLGVFSSLLLLIVSFVMDNPGHPFIVGRFFLDVTEPFVGRDGASIDFSVMEFVVLPLKYIIFNFLISGLFLSVFARKHLIEAFKRLRLILLANIAGFYIGFWLVGITLILIVGGAWANFSGF